MKYGRRDNEIAERLRIAGCEFLLSPAWRALRKVAVDSYGRKCMRCGTMPKNPRHTHVDHIKPRKMFPELALVLGNLQILCSRCNKAKANKIADYRPTAGRVC